MLLQVFRGVGLEERVGVYDGAQAALGEVSCARALCGNQVGFARVVLAEFGLDVVVYAGDFLVAGQYLSTITLWMWREKRKTFCRVSTSSAMGLSARYLTLFHWNDCRYVSTGSVRLW